jgi:hypothetical protein
MAELAERARRVRDSIMDHTRSDGVVPTRITYDSLWVHAKRHYDLAGTTAYWRARMHKELMKALGGNERRTYWIATNRYH